MIKETKINIILDNTRIHISKIVKKVADILNIKLIYFTTILSEFKLYRRCMGSN